MIESLIFEPRIIIALSMLGVAAFTDLRSRQVHDLVWIVFGSLGILMYFLDASPLQNVPLLIVASSLTVALAYAGYRMGLFASADALALVALTAIIPLHSMPNSLHGIVPLTVLTNASIIAALSLVANVARNLRTVARGQPLFDGFDEPLWKKAAAFLLGYRASRPVYAYSIEMQSASGKRFDFSLRNAEKDDYCATPNSWVMAGLPFVVYMLGGFVAMLLIGDIVALALTTLAG